MHRLQLQPFLEIRARMIDGNLYLRNEDVAKAFGMGEGMRGELYVTLSTDLWENVVTEERSYCVCRALYKILKRSALKKKVAKEIKEKFLPCVLRCERFCLEEDLANSREIDLNTWFELLRVYLRLSSKDVPKNGAFVE